MAELIFLRRTQNEIEIFGGEIFFDIDGKNAGKLSLTNQTIELPEGEHTIKMYKSHTFDTFIGTAESTINISADERLMVKYSAPMMVNQPGNMFISEYSEEKEKEAVRDREQSIKRDFAAASQQRQEAQDKYNTGVIIVFVVAVIFAIIFVAYEFMIFNAFR